jgi:excisionase family DNA binding protein
MTLKELGEQLRFSRRTIYKLLDDGEIPAIKIGNKWRFDRESVDSWLKQRSRGKKLRILVIDDEVAVRTLIARIFDAARNRWSRNLEENTGNQHRGAGYHYHRLP